MMLIASCGQNPISARSAAHATTPEKIQTETLPGLAPQLLPHRSAVESIRDSGEGALSAISIGIEIIGPTFYFLWPGLAAGVVAVALYFFPTLSVRASEIRQEPYIEMTRISESDTSRHRAR